MVSTQHLEVRMGEIGTASKTNRCGAHSPRRRYGTIELSAAERDMVRRAERLRVIALAVAPAWPAHTAGNWVSG